MNMSEWFGKNCKFQCCQWEENEETGGPHYKESEPCLVFCNHGQNPDNFEGNCNRTICPLAVAAPDMYEALKAAMRIKDLWCLLEDVSMEHDGEAEALGIMRSKFESAIARAEGKE
jgi:hypothetical protein